MELSKDQIQTAKRFEEDFVFRAKNTLSIRTTSGKITPITLNHAQLYVHEKLEEQKKKQGFVRAVIVKARKEGISTYTAARFFDKVIRNGGQKAFIVAHLDSATQSLYDMVDIMYENYPPFLRPVIKESNAKRLFFANGSGYSVGTAGGGSIGRGDTIQALHLSEVASYENPDEIAAGIMQAVPDVEGTEILLESTAKGKEGLFYHMAKAAMQSDSTWQLIFLPWFWLEDNRLQVPKNFKLTEEEVELKSRFKLDDEQIVWRRNKISVLGEEKFKQENPATLDEAFESTARDKLIPHADVWEARTSDLTMDRRQPIIGVDPAGSGKDKTAICCRRGRVIYKLDTYEKLNTSQIVELIIKYIRQERPAKVFIDKGFNPGIYDRLVELGFGSKVIAVSFGGEADDSLRYGNKRAEMYFRMKEWFADKPVRIPDDEELQQEICAIGVKESGGRNKIYLNEKKEIREALGRSPDKADSAALTWAFNVATYEDVGDDEEEEERERQYEFRNPITGY